MAFLSRLFVVLLCSFVGYSQGLWPEPVSFSTGATVLWALPHLEITISCQNTTYSSYNPRFQSLYVTARGFFLDLYSQLPHRGNHSATENSQLSEQRVLQAALQRTRRAVASTKFVPWKKYRRNEAFEPALSQPKVFLSKVRIYQASLAPRLDAATFFAADESYNISIAADGTANIKSNSTIGTIRALQTFEQLFYAHSSGSGVYTPYVPLSIDDAPTWTHRGLNLDIARNPFSPNDVLRTIDAMATAKMSRLHLHATDAQSWPITVPSLPDLAAAGAYQSLLTWSPSDLAEVQLYGLYRGISVFIEIDMPGHTGSIGYAYPDLITAFNESDWSTFAAEPGTGQLKLNSPAVYDFLKTLFADLLPRVSPYTQFFHNGGDEVNVNAFLLDETVRSNSSDVLKPLVQKLMTYVTGLVSTANLQPIVWEEMLLDWNLTLSSAGSNSGSTNNAPTGAIIQVWRSSANLLLVLQKGYRVIFGDYTHWYLDCGHGGFINPYPKGYSPPNVPYNTSGGVATQIADPFLDYCNPLKNWRHIYVYDPLINITSDLQHLIEGGEVHLWTEQTDPVDVDQKLWPRAAAAAEVLWSGPRNVSMIESASKRLAEWRERVVVDHGVGAGVVQMTWCLMEGGCNL
jgi:hexosaminidase